MASMKQQVPGLDQDGLPLTEDELSELWSSQLPKLHTCDMSWKYTKAMSKDGVINSWDFVRNTEFAMQTLLPRTKDLLKSKTRPTVSSFANFTWVSTKDPGTYGCLATKRDSSGKVVARLLKTGCAWSYSGGLDGRKALHLNPAESRECAARGSPFHAFIQSTTAEQTLELQWFTLSIGEPFVRKSESDEYLAGRYYQVEAMLCAAFGGLSPNSVNYKFRALKWWSSGDEDKDDDQQPWTGGDSHAAIEDVWSKRPQQTTEEERVEKAAAQAVKKRIRDASMEQYNLKNDFYLCSYKGCERSKPGNGFPTAAPRRNHEATHESEKSIANDLYLCPEEDCPKSETGCGFGTRECLTKHIAGHEAIKNDDYLCTHAGCEKAIPGNGFARKLYLQIHLDADPSVHRIVSARSRTCLEPRCGLILPTLDRLEAHEKQHSSGQVPCRACNLMFLEECQATRHAKEHCKVPNASAIHLSGSPHAACSDPRCGKRYPDTEGGRKRRDDHVQVTHIQSMRVCVVCSMPYAVNYKHVGLVQHGGVCPGSPVARDRGKGEPAKKKVKTK